MGDSGTAPRLAGDDARSGDAARERLAAILCQEERKEAVVIGRAQYKQSYTYLHSPVCKKREREKSHRGGEKERKRREGGENRERETRERERIERERERE